MTVEEFYERIGGDYQDVMHRLMKEDRVAKFVKMFLSDPSYNELKQAMADDNVDTAFKAAHTLKGVTANLSLSSLNAAAIDITEALRAGNMDLAVTLLPAVIQKYELIENLSKELD